MQFAVDGVMESSHHKFNVLFDYQRACNCYGATPASAQEATSDYKFQPNRLVQTTWSSPRTNRLLLEAGSAISISQWNAYWHPGVTPDIIRVTDVGRGISYGSQTSYRGWPNHTDRYSQRFSATYVTGTHSFKTGMQNEVLVTNAQYITNGNVNYTFRNGDPISITQYSTAARASAAASTPAGRCGIPVMSSTARRNCSTAASSRRSRATRS